MAGRPKAFKSPEELYKYFLDYLEWCKDNPTITKHYNVKTDSTGIVEHDRALAWEDFESYLFDKGIISDLRDYRFNRNNAYNEYSAIIRVIGHKMFMQQYNGAAIGEYSHNIVARKLGLIDKQEMKVQPVPATKEELQKAIEEAERNILNSKETLKLKSI